MNAEQYREFLDRIQNSEQAHHCKHGHLDCSDRNNGRCCDEEYQAMTDAERAKFERM